MMSPRTIALAGVLRHELARVGRPDVAVSFEADERTVALADADGRWRGAMPIAYGALVACGNGEGGNAQFWQRFG